MLFFWTFSDFKKGQTQTLASRSTDLAVASTYCPTPENVLKTPSPRLQHRPPVLRHPVLQAGPEASKQVVGAWFPLGPTFAHSSS